MVAQSQLMAWLVVTECSAAAEVRHFPVTGPLVPVYALTHNVVLEHPFPAQMPEQRQGTSYTLCNALLSTSPLLMIAVQLPKCVWF